jgi:TusA-related sulfurtransferase
MIRLDVRGYSCPEPVLRLKRAITEHDAAGDQGRSPLQIDLLVDNQASADVCKRFAQSKGYDVGTKRDGQDYILEITR